MSANRLSPPTPDPTRTCVFTIVSRNYFHFALNLMTSVAQHLPGARRVVVVCDATEGLDAGDTGIELLSIDDLPVPHVDRVSLHYTILELNTAIKPFAFERLFQAPDVEAVVYFDPDIELYSSGVPLLAQLERADVVLTPHLTAPLEDDRHPSDLSVLQSGTYNLGFLGLRQGDTAKRLLAWWGAKLVRDCVVDIPRGLFTDQKWIDLVPGFFDRVAIVRDPGWNVAYWNLAHRDVVRTAAGYEVNGQPLFFFHFSGRDPRSDSISKHQDRFTLAQCTPAVQQLFADYEASLRRHGRERYARMPYAFAALADGTLLPDIGRQVLRRELDWTRPMPDLRSLEGAKWAVAFLTEPVDRQTPPLSRLALQLHRSRADLQAAFPDVLGVHRHAYLAWFAERAGPEAGIAGELARDHRPARAAAAPTSTAATRDADDPNAPPALPIDASPAAPPPPQPASPPVTSGRWHYRVAYRVAWSARSWLRPVVPLALRQRARAALIRRAFPPTAPIALASTGGNDPAAGEPVPWGISVVGYVQAESGVGESARATLRALATTHVPYALADFRVGNVSRMGERVDERLARDRRHAVSLFHINADQLPVARANLDAAWFAVPHRIGYWAWELENFPPQWHESFKYVDEVWVPSSFCQNAVAAVSPVPVLCIPHAIEIPARVTPDRARFGLRPDSVVFLSMADMMSVAERKNPLGAVQAFVEAFAPDDTRAELVVKVSNPNWDPQAFERLRALAGSHPRVRLLADYLDRPALNALLDSVDVFVSLHRSEGFGLGIAEAMARGKVALATGWSGNMDFMTAHNSLPVDYELVRLERDAGPYARGERWAEPSLTDAVAKMRHLAADKSLRVRLGGRARADCRARLAPDVVGSRIATRLQAIRRAKGL